MKPLSVEDVIGLYGEQSPIGTGTEFMYHALLAILIGIGMAEDGEIAIEVDRLVGACERHQISMRFDAEEQTFYLGVDKAPDPELHKMCGFGWSLEENPS